jgi:hypothetical protein
MTAIAGKQGLIADRLITLASRELEVMLHPSDMVISGKEGDVSRARASLVEQLAFSKAYLTWDKESNALEDRIRSAWNRLRAVTDGEVPEESFRELQAIESDMRKTELPFEEWEALHRGKLLVERGMLQMAAGIASHPAEPRETSPEEMGASQIENGATRESGGIAAKLGTALTLGILAWHGFKLAGNRGSNRR